MATIVIDPGHGGSEDLLGSSANHAVGPGGTLEKTLTLDVAQRAASALVAAGHEVWLTRDQDINVSAADRARAGREHHAQIFLSIHFNAANDPSLQGTEVLVRPPQGGRLDDGSQRLADALRAELPAVLGIPDRGLRPGRWTVLNESLHDSGTARCLVEVAFLTDPALEAQLGAVDVRQGIGDALARSVTRALAASSIAVPAQPVAQRLGRAVGGSWPRGVGDTESYGRPQTRPSVVRRPGVRPFDAPDWCQLRFNMIKSADEEQGFWLRPDGTLRGESDATMLALLEKYWRDGAGIGNAADMARLSAADDDSAPWSAAFISWVVRYAGVPDSAGFVWGSAHIRYIVGALRNRENADRTRPFWLYDISEPEAAIIEGDIICKNRQVRRVWTTHTYESLKRDWWTSHRDDTPTGSSHSDIAIAFHDRDGRRFVECIGGNVGDTVGSTEYEVDANNRLVDPAGEHVFAVIRLLECPTGSAT
ncbi:MAG TPA: DUF2272 domain-containing protein [Nannocystaceae bacterium]|nr:DUF2272 domain-containing protein [Nannocystaceae bacterium]